MCQYNITEDAELDLREIARYTLSKFGPKQLEAYRQALNSTFNAIGRNDVIQRQFSIKRLDLLVTKCQHHYVFYIVEGVEKPTVIGVIHEARDIVVLLTSRLTGEGEQ
jgi:toxin ParE1/3/4|tara:strand:+ start:64 stop:387 length:324 start_codon:yes stop_codon:yes gene_type:complete